MGPYAGILLCISYCLAWAAIFVPRLAGNRRLMIGVAIVSLPCVLGYGHLLWGGLSPFLRWGPPILPSFLTLFVLIVYELVALAHRWPTKALPALSVLFLFLTAWAPLVMHGAAQAMWSGPGEVPHDGGFPVAVVDINAMFVAIFLAIVLWVRLAKRRHPGFLAVSSACAFTSAILSGLAFCYTIPYRGGDFGSMIFIILIPAELVVALITLVTCITVSAVSLTRARAARPPALPPVRSWPVMN